MSQDPKPDDDLPDDPDILRRWRESLSDEFQFRRRRRTDIFNSASKLLVAIIAGVIAVKVGSGKPLTLSQAIALTVSAACLTVCACLWWLRHDRYIKLLLAQLRRLDKKLGPVLNWPKDVGLVDGHFAMWVLGMIAIAAVWC